jgi:hypothetical protein
MTKQTKETDLTGLLENAQEGWGVVTVAAYPVGRDYVELGPVSERSFAHENPKNHRLASTEYTAFASIRDFFELAKTKGFRLEHKSRADMDGPIYNYYIIRKN